MCADRGGGDEWWQAWDLILPRSKASRQSNYIDLDQRPGTSVWLLSKPFLLTFTHLFLWRNSLWAGMCWLTLSRFQFKSKMSQTNKFTPSVGLCGVITYVTQLSGWICFFHSRTLPSCCSCVPSDQHTMFTHRTVSSRFSRSIVLHSFMKLWKVDNLIYMARNHEDSYMLFPYICAWCQREMVAMWWWSRIEGVGVGELYTE